MKANSINQIATILLSTLLISMFSVMTNTDTISDQELKTETGSIEGIVLEKDSKEPVIYGSVALYQNDKIVTGTETDFDGKFKLNNIPVGTYSMECSYTGFTTEKIEKVKVTSGETIKMTIELSIGVALNECIVIDYKVPLVTRDNTTQGMAMRGSRSKGTQYYIDGKRVRGNKIHPRHQRHRTPPPPREGTVMNTEDYSPIKENSFLAPSDDPLSTFSIDVDRASYANMRRFIRNGQEPPKDAVRIEEMVNYFHYEYEGPQGKTPFAVHNTLTTCPWNEDHQLLHIGLQGKRMENESIPASNLVFLLDVSGSMNAQNKLPLVKSSFKLLVNQLRKKDNVAIVVYAGAAGLVLPSTSGDKKAEILAAIDRLSAGGSTAGGQGIELAYSIAVENFVKGGNNRVILATDGDFNVGSSSDGAMQELIEKKRESGVFLTVLGFGMGNYKDNKMQILANKGNGNHAYIDDIQEARKMFIAEFGGTMFTIAKDVKIQIEFNPSGVEAYRLIGYENRMLAKEDFNDDKKDAGELGAGHTVTAIYEIIPKGVKSNFLHDVDALKYQKEKKKVNKNSKELCTIKLRYKKPNGFRSSKIEEVVANTPIPFESTSDNVRFAVAVAEFGMLLRDSEFKQSANYAHVETVAQSAIGKDKEGYRAEFIQLVRNVSATVASTN